MVSSSSPNSSSSILSRKNNDNNNNNNNNNNDSNNKNDTTPPALTAFITKCLDRFKQLPNHIATEINKNKLQKQLRSRVQTAKSHETLWTIDWNNEPFPPHCMSFIVFI